MNKKIECLNRLFKLLACRQEILEFLAEEKVIPQVAVQDILHSTHQTHAAQMATIMDVAVKEGQLQLVDYEWTILPVERVSLTIVSNNTKKEFKHGY